MDNGATSYRRFLDGDKEGLTEIVHTYADGLIFYVNSFVHDIHTAEDITEDVLAKLIAKKPHYSGRSSFKTWLYTIARNLTMDYLSRNSNYKRADISELDNISSQSDIEKRYIKNEQKRELHKIMQKLNPDYVQVLYLIYFEGFNNEETAHIMKKSKRQIENLLYRAKQALKNEFDKEGMTYEKL